MRRARSVRQCPDALPPADHAVRERVNTEPSPETDSELQELTGRVAAGDHDAFARLYGAMVGPVYGLTLKMLRDAAQAEEVAREVMVEVWRTAARFQAERGSVRTWVMTLAHRRAVDRIRSVQAVSDRENRSATRDRTRAVDEVGAQVEARCEYEQVRHCLRSLTEPQREAITLTYYEGLTYREVAASLSAPLGTVKARLRDALVRLRDGVS